MWHLVSCRSRSAYHYTVLSFGQDVVSVCWKVYEKLAFQEELSPKFTPGMQILVQKIACKNLGELWGRKFIGLAARKVFLLLPQRKRKKNPQI